MEQKIRQAKKIILEAWLRHGHKIGVSCSFGKDSVVLLDLCFSIAPDIPVISVLTPHKFVETWEFSNEVMDFFGKNWEITHEMEGLDVWDRAKCCDIKVPLVQKSLEPFDAWITGIRKDEGATRTGIEPIEKDKKHVKYNPLADFTELDIWKYIAWRKLPVHPLYMKGYRSLGCETCTSPTDDDGAERSGRWKGTAKQGTECGIHSRKDI